MDPLSVLASATAVLSSTADILDSLDLLFSTVCASKVGPTLSICADTAGIFQHLRRPRHLLQPNSNAHCSRISMSPQLKKQSSGYGSSIGPPSVTARAIERLAHLSECKDGSQDTEPWYKEEVDSIVDAIWNHVPKRARPRMRRHVKNLEIFWPRDSMPEFQPRKGRIMSFGCEVDSTPQDWDNPNAPRFASQSLLHAYVCVAAHPAGHSQHSMDGMPQTLDGKIDERRYPVWGGDVDKYNQVIPHCWARQEIDHKTNPVSTMTACKTAFNTTVDDMLQSSYEAGFEQFIKLDSQTRIIYPGFRTPAVFPGYRRLRQVLERFIYPLAAFSYPTTVSAATLSWRCNICNSERAPFDLAVNSNPVSVLTMPPGRHILQYLALCSVVFLLVYLQGTGAYLRHSFVASSGLLALICMLAGTEMMLRCLPLVVLVTLLASWGCQEFMRIIRGLPSREVQDHSAAISELAPRTTLDKNFKFSVT